MDYSKLKTRVENISQRDEEERKANAEKFSELYNSRNNTNETLAELSTTLKMFISNIDMQFKQLEKKIDELKR